MKSLPHQDTEKAVSPFTMTVCVYLTVATSIQVNKQIHKQQQNNNDIYIAQDFYGSKCIPKSHWMLHRERERGKMSLKHYYIRLYHTP